MISDPLRFQPKSLRQRQQERQRRRQQQQGRQRQGSKSDPYVEVQIPLSCPSPCAVTPVRRRRPTSHLETVISNMSPLPFPFQLKPSRQTATTTSSLSAGQSATICAHPVHYHSFSRPSSVVSFFRSRFRKCSCCNELLVKGSGGTGAIVSTADVLVCLACGIFVHRACGVGSFENGDMTAGGHGGKGKMEVCEVNRRLIEERKEFWDTIEREDEEREKEKERNTTEVTPAGTDGTVGGDDGDYGGVCSADAPPNDWALPSKDGLLGDKQTTGNDGYGTDTVDTTTTTTTETETTAIQQWEVSFAGMSRALQENILAKWTVRGSGNANANDEKEETRDLLASKEKGLIVSKNIILSDDSIDHGDGSNGVVLVDGFEHEQEQNQEETIMGDSVAIVKEVSNRAEFQKTQSEQVYPPNSTNATTKPTTSLTALLAHNPPTPPPPPPPTKIQTTLSVTKSILQKTTTTPRNIRAASIAGGIAGAAVGLLVAGPVGFIAGYKIGQVSCVVGVVVEGTVGVGVVAAGVAGGVMGAQQVTGEGTAGGRRILAIGEKGTVGKVVMVRPNVVVDPIWGEVTEEARRGGAMAGGKIRGIQGLVDRKLGAGAVDTKLRRSRDEVIARAHEDEIATEEKILLLVSSSLNDKRNLPGHVYRHLLREHQKRERERRRLRWEEDEVVLVDGGEDSVDDRGGSNSGSCRATREDTHAVIKYVTETLLEVRPGFGASARVAEMSATAVETIVFGEVYDLVFAEIIEETRDLDEALMTKISEFQIEVGRRSLSYDAGSETNNNHSNGSTTVTTKAKSMVVPNFDIEELVSDDALKSLRMLPESHSVAEKLYHCVQFLGFIASSSQLQPTTNGKNRTKTTGMSADSLLKMVCQHIIVAKVPSLNAEIVFLEEFARDEQLLKGKEGYALVTMQASLHFMNASTDFGKDIFYDEDD